MEDSDGRVKALEERVERLERQIAVLMKRTASAPPRAQSRDARDRYDALDYPER